MIKRYLGDYKNFRCIANECPATCCSGWTIVIDEDSLAKYKTMASKPGCQSIKANVDFKESCFKQAPNRDCAFLRRDGLCQMIIDYGEDCLCDTCDLYPRHMEEFPDVREYSLSVSCPVVAKKLLEATKPYEITLEEDEEQEEPYEDFDEELYKTLLEDREEVFKLLYDPSESFLSRSNKILTRARDLQNKLDGFDESVDDTSVKLENLPDSKILEAFDLLHELETMNESFKSKFKDWEKKLAAINIKEAIKAFDAKYPELEMTCNNLLIYFIYTYMCGAVYDDYVYSMMAQAVYSTWMIKLLWLAKDLEAGERLSIDQLSEIVYLYSRELEHSNENMILLEQMLDELDVFSIYNL